MTYDAAAAEARVQRKLGITHLGGVPWYEAEPPPWDHDSSPGDSPT